MSYDLSATGVSLTVIAVPAYPIGIQVTEFDADSDPFDSPNTKLADGGMGLNGDPVFWRTPSLMPFTINVIPDSDSDKNLQLIADVMRIGRDKASSGNDITIVANFPDGTKRILGDGSMVSAPPIRSPNSNGRFKTNSYEFLLSKKLN